MSLASIHARYDRAVEMKLREMAGVCEQLAEAGEFLPTGERCNYCVHALKDGGCRLRLLAARGTA